MANTKSQEHFTVSIIGSAYFWPIADLIERLSSLKLSTIGDRPGAAENGFAASICILMVATLESFAMRAWYLRASGQPPERRSGAQILAELFPDYPDHAKVAEIYILRNALVHNHPWEATWTWDDAGTFTLANADRRLIHVTREYGLAVDAESRTTKLLNLHVIPVQVGRRDAATVLKVTWDTMCFLEANDCELCKVSHVPVRFEGRRVLFGDVVREFAGAHVL